MTLLDFINPEIDPDTKGKFVEDAPVETIVAEDSGYGLEVYQKVSADCWRCLTDLETVGPAYLTYETWAKYSNEELLRYALSNSLGLKVLFLPRI